MHYLYHRVSADLQGDILYPLNALMDKYPDVYQRQMSKYDNRRHTPRQRIPLLDNCLWNDVIFLTAVHPSELYQERRNAGWPDVAPQRFFKIDPRILDQSKLGIFLFRPSSDPKHLVDEDFKSYAYEDLDDYAMIPAETKAYFRQEFEAGAPHIKLFFRYIPHALYRGAINIAHVEVITVN